MPHSVLMTISRSEWGAGGQGRAVIKLLVQEIVLLFLQTSPGFPHPVPSLGVQSGWDVRVTLASGNHSLGVAITQRER